VNYKHKGIFSDYWESIGYTPLDALKVKVGELLLNTIPSAKNHKMVGKMFCENGKLKQVSRYLSDSLWAYNTVEIQSKKGEDDLSHPFIVVGHRLYSTTTPLSKKGKLFTKSQILSDLDKFMEEKQCQK